MKIIASVTVGAILALSAASGLAQTYFIDSPRSYSAGNCFSGAMDIPAITVFEDRLKNNGWSGLHAKDSSAWPQDFIDYAFGGSDVWYADNRDLAVFNGHGKDSDPVQCKYGLAFSYSHQGKCWVTITDEMLLGWGAQPYNAKNVILNGCVTMRECSWNALRQNNQVQQMFDFETPVTVEASNATDMRDFYDLTVWTNNADAWFVAMRYSNDNNALNDPVVRTAAHNTSTMQNIRDYASLYWKFYTSTTWPKPYTSNMFEYTLWV